MKKNQNKQQKQIGAALKLLQVLNTALHNCLNKKRIRSNLKYLALEDLLTLKKYLCFMSQGKFYAAEKMYNNKMWDKEYFYLYLPKILL